MLLSSQDGELLEYYSIEEYDFRDRCLVGLFCMKNFFGEKTGYVKDS